MGRTSGILAEFVKEYFHRLNLPASALTPEDGERP
jgi:hypothetical protein